MERPGYEELLKALGFPPFTSWLSFSCSHFDLIGVDCNIRQLPRSPDDERDDGKEGEDIASVSKNA